ncbi:ABC transporter ATP-binding protein [Desulfurivibrio dismutans]|uniref:ABC transporter ATP-binding protein n=1 Tax=Desulfurivibrio dismutans TaxID=1398908 RepID=UPI0023DCE3F5|nr:ABC transporter ATP-binding protein [Desulfurivibrio alkaliphilus]MDF1614284.1 ABC transporter ATP-binding protein [Desulfurivibrio alkaliphilus]
MKVKIEASGVGKRFRRRLGAEEVEAMAGLELNVYQGELLCLLGPNGCGKTTLLNLLAGFDTPTAGSISLDGCPVRMPGPEAVMIQQEYGLFPWRTVRGNVELGLELARVPAARRRRLALELIALVGLNEAVDRYPRELSGGMQQRVALARALAVEPQVLFMDEPFGALDAMTRHKMQAELIRLWREKEMTIIFVTHDFNEALLLADRVAVMTPRPGRIKEIITINQPRPRNLLSPEAAQAREAIHRALVEGIMTSNPKEPA